ncbi:MAG: hypothetical protein ACOYOK_10870, partial [Pseudobdellovibrionaceae bacterium]
MNRVLLVYENYQELMAAEVALKKSSYEVLSITNEFTLVENVLSFNPQIVVGYGQSSKVSTLGVGRRLRDLHRWKGKVVLIFTEQNKPSADGLLSVRMDLLLQAPVVPDKLLQVMNRLTDQESTLPQDSSDTGQKSVTGKKESSASSRVSDSVYVQGGGVRPQQSLKVESEKESSMFADVDLGQLLAEVGVKDKPSAVKPKSREKKYQEWLGQNPLPDVNMQKSTLTRKEVHSHLVQQKESKIDEKNNEI